MVIRKVSNQPTSVDVNAQRVHMVWDDGHQSDFPAGYLRAACQCANCVHELTGAAILDKNSIPENIHLLAADPTGHYAVTFRFSDYHDTGIFTYEHLRKICPCDECQCVRK